MAITSEFPFSQFPFISPKSLVSPLIWRDGWWKIKKYHFDYFDVDRSNLIKKITDICHSKDNGKKSDFGPTTILFFRLLSIVLIKSSDNVFVWEASSIAALFQENLFEEINLDGEEETENKHKANKANLEFDSEWNIMIN